MKGLKAHGLQGLAALRAELRRREQLAREQAAREAAERAAQLRRRDWFARAVGPVTPVDTRGRAELPRARPAPEPRQHQADEAQALRQSLSDEVDVESLLLTDDGLSFHRPGVSADVVNRLRRDQWALQAQLDLHGLRRDEARERVAAFVRESRKRGQRCVRVVHGKGHGSPGREPVLKAKVQRWLAQCDEVIAFTQAPAHDGGAGALIVLLA